jgi:hypothetical protein
MEEQFDEPDRADTFEKVESWPTIEQIERRLRQLGCTKEQVKRHLDQVALSRTEAVKKKTKQDPSPLPGHLIASRRSALRSSKDDLY